MGYLYQDNVNSSLGHTEAYSYDSLNRLTNAVATGNSTYNLTFAYDRYGNMTCQATLQTQGLCPNYVFDQNTNRISTTGFSYDAAGNLTQDVSTNPANTYQWDAEGRLSAILHSGTTFETLTYNARGQVVEGAYPGYNDKVEGVFDPSGKELGYYNGVGGAWWDRDIWGAGRMVAQSYSADTYFLHANLLHSDTQITDYSGAVQTDFIYYPWQIWTEAGNMVDAHFAGFQQSGGPNYPTPSRQYSGGISRWLSPDPNNAGDDPSNPQSWNAYSYAGNNPTTLTDPSGEDYELCVNNDNGDTKCTHIQNEAAFQAALANPGSGITIKGNEQSGVIYGTDPNGNPVQEGTYKQVVGPGTEGGGIQDVSAPLVGLVAGGVSLIRSVGADLFEGFFERETPEGGAAATATVENPVVTPDAPQVTLTEHAAQRAAERGMTQADIDTAVRTAKETGQVARQVGKYGTPQNIYKGMNNITVVVETAGRNAGKAVTVFRT